MNQFHESILKSSGFEIGTIAQILTEEQLQSQNTADLSLIEFLCLENNAFVQMLQEDLVFKSLFLQSLTHHQYPIPNNWQILDGFSLVCLKDKKVAQKDILNGLFYYCNQYAKEHQRHFKSIVRTNGNRALLFTLDSPERHLTIDETISSISDRGAINTYAHVTYKKGPHTLRFYFSNDLKLVKTTAFIEEHQQKIPILNLDTLDIHERDYQIGLELLEYLKTQHELKIKDLDIKLTPKFLFISTKEILDDCQQLISEINALKSPMVDRRKHILQRLQNFDMQTRTPKTSSEISMTASASIDEKFIHDHKPKSLFTKKKNKTSKSAQILNEINHAIIVMHESLKQTNLSTSEIESLFNHLQSVQINIVYHFDILAQTLKEQFELKCKEITQRVLSIIHQAYQEEKFEYLNELYDSCHEYIDGLLMGLIIKFQEKTLTNGRYTSAEAEEMIQMIDLIMHFYEKNKIYVIYLELLRDQCGINFNEHKIFSVLFKVIICFNHPKFILFLIEKNILKPTDCIGIFNNKYTSLYQYLLIESESIYEEYFVLLEKFSSENIPILEITNKSHFESLVQSTQNLVSLNPSNGRAKAFNRSEKQLLNNISSSIQDPHDLSMISIFQWFVSSKNSIYQNFARVIAVQNPTLAFFYMAFIINDNYVCRRILNTNRNTFAITGSNEEAEQLTEDLTPENQSHHHIGFIYYPDQSAPAIIHQKLRLTSSFFQLLVQHNYLQPTSHVPAFISELYQNIVELKNPFAQIIVIDAIQLYMASIENWTAEFYKKYCFYALLRVEIMNNYRISTHQIPKELIVTCELMSNTTDIQTRHFCRGFIASKLEKITEIPEVAKEYITSILP